MQPTHSRIVSGGSMGDYRYPDSENSHLIILDFLKWRTIINENQTLTVQLISMHLGHTIFAFNMTFILNKTSM